MISEDVQSFPYHLTQLCSPLRLTAHVDDSLQNFLTWKADCSGDMPPLISHKCRLQDGISFLSSFPGDATNILKRLLAGVLKRCQPSSVPQFQHNPNAAISPCWYIYLGWRSHQGGYKLGLRVPFEPQLPLSRTSRGARVPSILNRAKKRKRGDE